MTAPQVLVFDIGGTKTAAAVVDGYGQVVERRSRLTAGGAPSEILDDLVALGRDLMSSSAGEVAAIGVATAGVVDRKTGQIRAATDLLVDWVGAPIAARLETAFGMPVVVDNDVNAWLAGEHQQQVEERDVLMVAVGTGLGGAWLLDGQLWRGPAGWAGEIAHMPDPGGRDEVCSCGCRGHLEPVVSGPGMVRQYNRHAVRRANDLPVVVERAHAGDAWATQVVADGATSLGRALAGLATAVGVPQVVVGGGVACVGDVWWHPLATAFQAAAPPRSGLHITSTRLAGDAPLVGMAHLAVATLEHRIARDRPRSEGSRGAPA